MILVLRNYTTDERLTPSVLQRIADALSAQLNQDVSPWWGGGYVVRYEPDTQATLTDEEIELAIFQHSDQANAAGYHATDPRGKAYAKVFLDDADALGIGDTGLMPLTTILSHEACEAAGDEAANKWSDRQDGTEEALELCDRCEDSSYDKNGVTVSNFLLPYAFDPAHSGPYCFMDLRVADESDRMLKTYDALTPGGYVILRQQGGDVGTAGAEHKDEHWMKRKSFAGSRTARRGVVFDEMPESGPPDSQPEF